MQLLIAKKGPHSTSLVFVITVLMCCFVPCWYANGLQGTDLLTGRNSSAQHSTAQDIINMLVCCFVCRAMYPRVQGMNFLVGLLLLSVERDCLRCFWLMVVLLEEVRGGVGEKGEGGARGGGGVVCRRLGRIGLKRKECGWRGRGRHNMRLQYRPSGSW
jgi:hypothetical protein